MSKQFTWEEIRTEILTTVNNLEDNLEEGVIQRFELQQDFDANADYVVVLSYSKYNNISLDLVREAHENTPVETDWSPGSGVKWNGSGFPEEEFDDSINWIEKCWKDWVEGFPAWWGAKTYKPAPIDTSGVELPEEITELTEKLAESTHDIWAQNRFAQGWTYGKYRDDEEKLHPCLAPYETLPEEEKKYDRDTAMETLKAIYALGYSIETNKEHYYMLFDNLRKRIKLLAETRGLEWEKLAWRCLGEELVRINYLFEKINL